MKKDAEINKEISRYKDVLVWSLFKYISMFTKLIMLFDHILAFVLILNVSENLKKIWIPLFSYWSTDQNDMIVIVPRQYKQAQTDFFVHNRVKLCS